jgi:hypothetical protein
MQTRRRLCKTLCKKARAFHLRQLCNLQQISQLQIVSPDLAEGNILHKKLALTFFGAEFSFASVDG